MNKIDNKIAHVFLLYWVVLVIWQNISRAQARSGIDLLIKVALIAMLTVYYFMHSKGMSRNILIIIGFSLMVIAVFAHSQDMFSGSVLISYTYPVLLAFLAYGLGNSFQITKKELRFFLNGVVVVVLYCALYAVVFQTNHFLNAFSVNKAYGNELSSFFLSSHEYGMYLVYAIVSCMLLLEFGVKKRMRWVYWGSIVLFTVNLFLTFSRTSLLAMLCFAVFFVTFNKRAGIRKLLIVSATVLMGLVIFVAPVRELILVILFKAEDGGIGEREVLMRLGIRMFEGGDLGQKILGNGVTVVSETVRNAVDRGSLHNAYLQVLVTYGLAGLGSMLLFMISQAWACIRLYRSASFYAVLFLGLILSAAAMMFTNTSILFTSPIDSYFMTVFVFLVPKYVRNAIKNKNFD